MRQTYINIVLLPNHSFNNIKNNKTRKIFIMFNFSWEQTHLENSNQIIRKTLNFNHTLRFTEMILFIFTFKYRIRGVIRAENPSAVINALVGNDGLSTAEQQQK